MDTEKTIRWVSIKADGPWTKGLRLIDENNETIVEETWNGGNHNSSGDWTTPQLIPDGMSIIGLQTTILNDKGITFGFNLWYPPSEN